MSAVDERAEVGLLDAGILAGGLRDGPIEGFEDAEESGGLRGRACDEGFQMLAGPLAELRAVEPAVCLEELQEADGLSPVELRLLDREHGGHLLLERQGGDSLGHGDGEDAIGEKGGRVGGEPLQDLETPLHPGLPLPQSAGDGVGAEAIAVVEIVEDLELLPEGGAPGGVIEAEAVDPGLGPGPGLPDDPGLLLPARLQGEEPPEAIDQEEPSGRLDDHQGVIGVQVGGECRRMEEVEGDGREGHLLDAHGRHPPFASAEGRESTWKVG